MSGRRVSWVIGSQAELGAAALSDWVAVVIGLIG